jgi:hypothetical protein
LYFIKYNGNVFINLNSLGAYNDGQIMEFRFVTTNFAITFQKGNTSGSILNLQNNGVNVVASTTKNYFKFLYGSVDDRYYLLNEN